MTFWTWHGHFLLEFFNLMCNEICDRIFRSWEGNQLRNAFHEVWNATPFPKDKVWGAVRGPPTPYSTLPSRDAQAELAAAVEEGILEVRKQASLQIRTEGAQKVASWLKSIDLCGPQVCPAPAGHEM